MRLNLALLSLILSGALACAPSVHTLDIANDPHLPGDRPRAIPVGVLFVETPDMGSDQPDMMAPPDMAPYPPRPPAPPKPIQPPPPPVCPKITPLPAEVLPLPKGATCPDSQRWLWAGDCSMRCWECPTERGWELFSVEEGRLMYANGPAPQAPPLVALSVVDWTAPGYRAVTCGGNQAFRVYAGELVQPIDGWHADVIPDCPMTGSVPPDRGQHYMRPIAL